MRILIVGVGLNCHTTIRNTVERHNRVHDVQIEPLFRWVYSELKDEDFDGVDGVLSEISMLYELGHSEKFPWGAYVHRRAQASNQNLPFVFGTGYLTNDSRRAWLKMELPKMPRLYEWKQYGKSDAYDNALHILLEEIAAKAQSSG